MNKPSKIDESFLTEVIKDYFSPLVWIKDQMRNGVRKILGDTKKMKGYFKSLRRTIKEIALFL